MQYDISRIAFVFTKALSQQIVDKVQVKNYAIGC